MHLLKQESELHVQAFGEESPGLSEIDRRLCVLPSSGSPQQVMAARMAPIDLRILISTFRCYHAIPKLTFESILYSFPREMTFGASKNDLIDESRD